MDPTTYEIRLPDRTVTIERDDVQQLSLWLPECGGGPRGADAATVHEAVRLYALGLLDAQGNVTAAGRIVIALVDEDDAHIIEQGMAEVEMAEFDRLDAACRRRPRFLRYDGAPADWRDQLAAD
jgi:hypothetical protein